MAWKEALKRKIPLHLVYQAASGYMVEVEEMFGVGLTRQLFISRLGLEISYRWEDDLARLSECVHDRSTDNDLFLWSVAERIRGEHQSYQRVLSDWKESPQTDWGGFYRSIAASERRSITSMNFFYHIQDYIQDLSERYAEAVKQIAERRNDAALIVMYEAYRNNYWGLFVFLSATFNIPLLYVPYLLPHEIENMLNGSSTNVSEEDLRKRYESYLFLYTEDEQKIYTGAVVSEITSRELGSQKRKFTEELCGVSVSPGIIRGVVRIVMDEKDLASVQDGDVLVAIMTRPTFVSIIPRVAAIVTDEGGVLCHAGIVAREFDKPCVVGTKHATEILKNGDFVEVDAEGGIIRRITN